MNYRVVFVAVGIALLAGCNNNTDDLQRQLAQSQSDQAAQKQLVSERDKYIEEVIAEVNDVYKDLEQSRVKEGRLLKQSKGSEWNAQPANIDTRQKLLADITDIGSALKENRKRIGAMEARMRKMNLRISSLDSLIANLKTTIQEREASNAQLQSQVQGLEATVAEKTRMVQDREVTIDDQQRQINTAFYVVGTRDELKKKGIITDEGGFLWGLLGSTTVLGNDLDPTDFTAIDKSRDQTIHIQGKIDEILPRRTETAFATAQKDDNSSDLTIVQPNKFWLDKYLVIVTD